MALAIKKHNHRIARALVSYTNPNITNQDGRSALHVAYDEDDYDMVELLEYRRVNSRLGAQWGRLEKQKDVSS